VSAFFHNCTVSLLRCLDEVNRYGRWCVSFSDAIMRSEQLVDRSLLFPSSIVSSICPVDQFLLFALFIALFCFPRRSIAAVVLFVDLFCLFDRSLSCVCLVYLYRLFALFGRVVYLPSNN
jgi:hypothetical protein